VRAVRLRRGARAMAILAATAILAACGGSTGGSSPSSASITLYSGQHQETTDALVEAFEKQTGIKVDVRYDDEDALADAIITEGSHSPADVFYTENTPPLQELQDKGLLAPIHASALAETPSKYNSAKGDWVGVSARVSVLIYNPSLIQASQLPTTILQLGAPKYKGKLAIAAGETDFYSVVSSVDRAYGQARTLSWLRAIKANAGSDHTYPDNETIADEVNRGQVAFGLVNQYYWYRMGAEIGQSHLHSKVVHFAPHDPGYVLDVSGAGILKSSKHEAEAQRLVAFLVSKAGQEVIAHSLSYEYPLDHGVAQPAETPFADLEPNSISIADLGTGSTAIALMRKAGLL
jgi:iron(III) transport system substrate-binding protein